MNLCPTCKGASAVTDSRQLSRMARRKRRCIRCGGRWQTFELLDVDYAELQRRSAVYDQFMLLLRAATDLPPPPDEAPWPDPEPIVVPEPIPDLRVRRLRASKRGVDVPDALEGEWKTLMKSGYTVAEARQALKL